MLPCLCVCFSFVEVAPVGQLDGSREGEMPPKARVDIPSVLALLCGASCVACGCQPHRIYVIGGSLGWMLLMLRCAAPGARSLSARPAGEHASWSRIHFFCLLARGGWLGGVAFNEAQGSLSDGSILSQWIKPRQVPHSAHADAFLIT